MATVHPLKPQGSRHRPEPDPGIWFHPDYETANADLMKRCGGDAFIVWLRLLAFAVQKECVVEVKGGMRLRLRPGQLVTTVDELVKLNRRLTRKRVRGILNYLIDSGRTLDFAGNWGRVITILDWEKYASPQGFMGLELSLIFSRPLKKKKSQPVRLPLNFIAS